MFFQIITDNNILVIAKEFFLPVDQSEVILVPTPPTDGLQVLVALVKYLVYGFDSQIHGDKPEVVKTLDGLFSDTRFVHTFAGPRSIRTAEVLPNVAVAQIPLSNLGAGEVPNVSVVHLVHTNVKHLDKVPEQKAMDFSGREYVVGANEDLI